MSTLELENIKHPDNSGNNLTLAADGSVSKIHVKSGDAGSVSASPQADDLVVEASTEAGITLISPDDQSARIRFTSPSTDAGDVGGATVFYRQNINKMSIGTEVAGGQLALKSGAGAENLKINALGYVTTPNQVSFYARISGSWSSVGNAAEIVPSAAFNTTPLWNNGNGFSGNRFTAPIAGKYMFIFSAEKANNAADATSISIHKNGSEILNARIYHAVQDHRKTLQYTMIMDLAVNDYAEPFTNSYRSGVAWDNRGQFAGYLIG